MTETVKVPVLKQGDCLIATIQSALIDTDWERLSDDLSEKTGKWRARGVILDVTVLDILDSFATRTLHTIAQTLKLRGAETVIVGIQPEVAMAMVQLGLMARLESIPTGLDLEEGLAFLQHQTEVDRRRAG